MIDGRCTIHYNYIPIYAPLNIVSNKVIPFELISKIFSHSDPEILSSTILVSKGFNEASILTVKQTELSKLSCLDSFVNGNITDESCKLNVNNVLDVGVAEILLSTHMPGIMSFSNTIIEKSMDIFIDLEETELVRLSLLTEVEFLKEIFYLSNINKKLKEFKESRHDFEYPLCDICMDLSEKRYFDIAIKWARTISNESFQKMTYESICSDMMQNKEVDKALNLARETAFSSSLIFIICDFLLKQGEVEEVKKIANASPSEEIKIDTIGQICKYLTENDNLAKAIEYSNKESLALFEIVCVLSKNTNFDKATEVASSIPIEAERIKALSRISYDRSEKNQGPVSYIL